MFKLVVEKNKFMLVPDEEAMEMMCSNKGKINKVKKEIVKSACDKCGMEISKGNMKRHKASKRCVGESVKDGKVVEENVVETKAEKKEEALLSQ